MNEMEAAKRIAEGSLPSPYKHVNMTLWAIRITGVGMAYRDSLDEYVWRSPDIFLAPEFIERVQGLPVILEHPEKGSLNSEEFHDRVIGTCMFGYVKGDELWAVSRIYDDEAIELMSKDQLSTSPGVVFGPKDGNVTKESKDGDVLLIEASPSTLCHICVTKLGVWDKGGPPTGVQNDTLHPPTEGTLGMADEEKKADAEGRHDAAMNEKLDAIMDAFKKMDARLDSFEKEKNDKARHDTARKDKFGHRKDGEKYDEWKKRHDADEEAMADAMKCDGASEKDCMDAAKRARHDAENEEKRHDKDFEKWAKEEEEEPEHKEDKKRKDSEDEKFKGEREDKSRRDAEASEDKKKEKEEEKAEKEEEKPDSRKDSAVSRDYEDLKAKYAKLESMVKGIVAETPGEDRDRLAATQARADAVCAMFGDRAPSPIPGEAVLDYRKRLLKRLAPHSAPFKNSRFEFLDDAQVTMTEDRVYADAANSARSVNDARPGVLVPYEERDRAGRTITKFAGDIGAFLASFVISEPITGHINRKPGG